MHPTLYALIPAAFALFGGLIAAVYSPKATVSSLLQHFVAGVIIAAVAIDLLPKIMNVDSKWSIGLGFLIGIAFMVALHELAHIIAHKKEGGKLPLRLIGASAIDLFIDGILIGLAFIAGSKSGVIITWSLIPCAFFLTLTVGNLLKKKSLPLSTQILFLLFLALMFPLGAFIGSHFAESLPTFLLHETIAAAIAALLYLGVEEFLVEAHRKRENHWVPLAFFLGFGIVLLFQI